MNARRIPLIFILLILLAICTGCQNGDAAQINAADAHLADAIEATPTASPVPTPAPTMVPPPPDDEVLETFETILRSIPAEYDFMGEVQSLALPERPLFSDIVTHASDWKQLVMQLHLAICNACEDAVMQLEDGYPDIVLGYTAEIERLDWKYAGSVLWALPKEATPWELFDIASSLHLQDDGTYRLNIQITPMNFQQYLYGLAGPDRDLYMDARYIMTYMTTVYDGDGLETEYVMPELSAEYVAGIQKPVERTAFFDRWYQGRSRDTRKHTGLDLRASANSEIRSCTDGTVLYIGYQDIPGYYVVVLDDQGYEYHYYHMIRQTTFLREGQRIQAGDLIGHVGNTGNSAVNHLHLSLITPDSQFVKIYDIMKTLYSK